MKKKEKKQSSFILILMGILSLLVYPFIMIALRLKKPKEYRFYRLGRLINKHLRNENYNEASHLANEYLNLAENFKNDWNYGNAIHDGHQTLGLSYLAKGNIKQAKEELILAGQTPGSPQLDSFGPRMVLAKKLLEKKEKDVVLQYLDLVEKFWANTDDKEFIESARKHKNQIINWKNEIIQGNIPKNNLWNPKRITL